MQIKYSPVRSDDVINYTFEGEIITVEHSGIEDTFDFSGFTDGQSDVSEFETELPFNPIISAKRENGELFVELINYIGAYASYEERYPQWEVVEDGENKLEDS